MKLGRRSPQICMLSLHPAPPLEGQLEELFEVVTRDVSMGMEDFDQPGHDAANVPILAALGSQGIEAGMTSDGATGAGVFRAYVEQVLRPTLRLGDSVIMDNLRAPKAAGIREAIEQAGTQVVYLPPYSPDVSPIEPCWSTLKTALRTAKARAREALEHAIAQAPATNTVVDAHSWFQHCGYALH